MPKKMGRGDGGLYLPASPYPLTIMSSGWPRSFWRTLAVAAVIGVNGASGALAGSFYIPQQSVSGVGNAFVGGSVLALDASTIFSNPAGMTKLEGAQANVGANLLVVSLDFENKNSSASSLATGGSTVSVPGSKVSNPYDPALVPNLYAAVPLFDTNAWLGFGVTAPFGLATKYTDTWFGRYDSIETSVRTVNLGPSFAYRITDYLSVGVGFDAQYANAKLVQALPDPANPGGPTSATDGRSNLRGDSWAFGFNAGVLLEPLPGTRLGLHYRSRMNHTLDGRLKVRAPTGVGGGSQTVGAKTDLNLPDIVTAGISHEVTPKLTLAGEFQWFNWSRFKEIRARLDEGFSDQVRKEGYRNTITAGVSANYALDENWSFRGGFQYDQTPTRNKFRNTGMPDADRYWIGVGVQYRIGDAFRVDASYAGTIFEKSQVDITRTFFDGAASVRTRGRSQYHGDTYSLGLSYIF